jgi:hypothetical protein
MVSTGFVELTHVRTIEQEDGRRRQREEAFKAEAVAAAAGLGCRLLRRPQKLFFG